MRWDAQCDISGEGCKKFTAVKEGDRVVDYQDVTISGYLSTFGNFDRDGETVAKGAFTETIPDFMRNPVLLVNHRNAVEFQAGSFTKISEDAKGLKFEATISNGSSDMLKHTRALVAEGHLRTVSMGGIFHRAEDQRTIFRVDLYEGSIVPIPANPKALFAVRELTDEERKTVQQNATK